MGNWFTIDRLDSGTHIISEYRHWEETHCYLLHGEERSLLIDSGLGICRISGEVSRLVSGPVIPVATHIHWDHIGGHAEFPEEGFDVSGYEMFQGQPSRVLHDGDKIELGGRSVEVLHTPGHSPGHMCFWEPDRRWLYTGDLVYADILLAYYPSTDPEAYLDSLERIAALQAERIFPAHHSLDVKPELVLRMRDALRELKARGELHHGSGVHNYGDWGIWL